MPHWRKQRSHLEEDEVPLAAEAVEGDEEYDAGRGVGQTGEVVVQEDVPVELRRVEGQAEISPNFS